jgi:hypothetical protein
MTNLPEPKPGEAERSLAIEAILGHAPSMGIEASIEKFGSNLTSIDKELIGSLTQEELEALKAIEGKLSPLRTQPQGNNNNNNNRPQPD